MNQVLDDLNEVLDIGFVIDKVLEPDEALDVEHEVLEDLVSSMT